MIDGVCVSVWCPHSTFAYTPTDPTINPIYPQGTGVWSWIKMKRDKKGAEDNEEDGPSGPNAAGYVRGWVCLIAIDFDTAKPPTSSSLLFFLINPPN